MGMNALEIIQRACNAIGIPEPSSAVTSTQDDVIQLVELLNQEGRQLSSAHDWSAMAGEGTFTTVASEDQGAISSFLTSGQELRKIVNDTIWNRTAQRPVFGPMSKQRIQAHKALALTGPYSEYFIGGGHLYFYPAPTAGEDCYFEYFHRMWATDSTGATYKRNVSADADIFLLDDELMLAGLEWRWLRKKGLSYAEEFATYQGLVNKAIANDGTKATLKMDGPDMRVRAGTFVPVGSWPL